jgi:hypothetical protein
MNPCTKQYGGCAKDAECTFLGSNKHTCTCNDGFSGDGKTCVDPGKCAVNNGGCDEMANCTKRGNGVKCICRPGYTGSGKAVEEGSSAAPGCAPIDPCSVDWGKCHLNAKCTTVNKTIPWTNNCTCNAGFRGNGRSCVEFNPCTEAPGCDADAHCLHMRGDDFQCLCNEGFKGSGYACHEVTPCEVDCDENAYCKKTPHGQKCVCKNGFTGNGTTCEEVNNCEFNNGECHKDAICQVMGPGVSTCKCKKGFTGDGSTTCNAINVCKRAEQHQCHDNATCH